MYNMSPVLFLKKSYIVAPSVKSLTLGLGLCCDLRVAQLSPALASLLSAESARVSPPLCPCSLCIQVLCLSNT